jgi:para-nitrobenzyl esterase
MQSYFANFILTGNPNGKGLPNWNPVSVGTTSEVMHIGERTRAEKESHPERYQQLNRISASTPQ